MLVRNLDYLSIPKEFKKVETNIYDNKSIALVFIENKGYSLVLKDDEHIDSVFLLKTSLTPNNINENNDKEDFINVIKMLLEKVYSEYTIKEYEKQHQEHVFLRLMDMLTDGDNIELISEENSKIYSDIEKGFMKLELDIMIPKSILLMNLLQMFLIICSIRLRILKKKIGVINLKKLLIHNNEVILWLNAVIVVLKLQILLFVSNVVKKYLHLRPIKICAQNVALLMIKTLIFVETVDTK